MRRASSRLFGAAAAAFATINFLRQKGLICAAVATDRTPETPSSG
jgi:hypothetical protein